MSDTPLRKQVHPKHIIITTGGYRLLEDDEVIQDGDETALVSMLFQKGEVSRWTRTRADHVGQTVTEALENDMDDHDRLYRRREGEQMAEHVCDYRCLGESGHHAWPSPKKS